MEGLTRLQIPDGFEEVLQTLIKEILREQPDDVLYFCYAYFMRKKGVEVPTKSKNAFGKQMEAEIANELSGTPEDGIKESASQGLKRGLNRQGRASKKDAARVGRKGQDSDVQSATSLNNVDRPGSSASLESSSSSRFKQSRIEEKSDKDSYAGESDQDLLLAANGTGSSSKKGNFKIKGKSRTALPGQPSNPSIKAACSAYIEDIENSIVSKMP